MNEQEIRDKYAKLQKNGLRRLLPLHRIIALEQFGESLKKKYFTSIIRITAAGDVELANNLSFSKCLEECIKHFGENNYHDVRFEDNRITIIYIFDLCQITISQYGEKITNLLTIYWDT